MADGEFPAGRQIDLQPGDLLFLFTDGVTEALAADYTVFGIDRALELLRDNCSSTAGELVEALYRAVMDYGNQPTLEDDFTAIITKVL
jgi:sigma-B regulation protein RsbU (phosphoserine phosphatase)